MIVDVRMINKLRLSQIIIQKLILSLFLQVSSDISSKYAELEILHEQEGEDEEALNQSKHTYMMLRYLT